MDDECVLTIEIGNAETNMGLFAEGELIARSSITTARRITADEAQAAARTFLDMKSAPDPDGTIMCSVVPALTDTWACALGKLCGTRPLVVGPGLKSGIAMGYKDPGQMGADRVACAVAAKAMASAPVAVVDFSSTTTITVVDDAGRLLGGTIALGLAASMEALGESAAQLTEADLRAPRQTIGRTTADAIRTGIVLGEAARVDGLIDAIWKELGYPAPLIATGRYAETVCACSHNDFTIVDDLALRGLLRIWQLNEK